MNESFFKFTQSIHGVNKGYSIRVAKIWDDFDNGIYLSDLNIYNAANDGTVLLDDIIELSSIKLRRPNGTFADVEYRVVITSQGKVRMISKFNMDKIVNSAGNTLFNKSIIANINGFSDNILSLANNQGLTLNSFKNLQLQTAIDLTLTNPEGLAKIISIRNLIPNPNSNTIIQKVIPLNKIDDFIVKGYKPRGFVTTAADSKHLNSYAEIYDGMRLDYKIDDVGTQAFNSSDNGCYVIRFKATNANQAIPAVNLPDPDPFPYTNHGFTSGENNLGVPEWKMPDAEISEGIIYRKNADGSEVEYAIWDATLNKFILK